MFKKELSEENLKKKLSNCRKSTRKTLHRLGWRMVRKREILFSFLTKMGIFLNILLWLYFILQIRTLVFGKYYLIFGSHFVSTDFAFNNSLSQIGPLEFLKLKKEKQENGCYFVLSKRSAIT